MYIGLLVLLGAAYYFMNPVERARSRQLARRAIEQAYETAQGGAADSPFRVALREKTAWAPVTPALLLLNLAMLAFMMLGRDHGGEAQTLVAWGANTGPRTTNGEWQRLVTSIFVHAGIFHFMVNMAGLAALGFITERLVGPITFGTTYVAAGLMAGIVSLAVDPMGVSFGASGAILGTYGLLAAVMARSLFRRPEITIPSVILKRLGATAGVFILYNAVSGSLAAAAELSGFAMALVLGLLLAPGAVDPKPHLRRVAATAAALLIVAVGLAASLRGIDDVRPEVESVVATERRTADAYDAEVERYKARKVSETALVQMIDGRIIPELRAAAARLESFDKVPAEQRQLIASANAYLRLREESWQLRAEGLRQMIALRRGGGQRLHTSSTLALRKAETMESAALDALQGVGAGSQVLD